jgi:flagellar hook-associated protein 3 FlgL
MRVTENTNFDTIRNTINRSKSRMEDLQMKSATMKKLNTPSDDPVGAAKVLEVRTEKVNNDQYETNGKLAETFLNNTDSAVQQLTEIVDRAKEIALGQSSGASSNPDTRLGVAEEVTQLYQQAISTANRRIGDRYLFGGYKTQRPPVDPDGRYLGDDGHMMVEIARDVFLSMNIPGLEAFNTQPQASADSRQAYGANRAPATGEPASPDSRPRAENVNVFDELQNLRIALLTGDLDGIRNTLDRFDQMHAQLVATRSKIGSRINGLQSTIQAIDRHNITNAQLTSQLEDADMAKVVSNLAKEETVFRSALQSSQRLVQPTLMEFLK